MQTTSRILACLASSLQTTSHLKAEHPHWQTGKERMRTELPEDLRMPDTLK